MIIPFNKVFYTGNEIKYIEDAIKKGQICGDGYYTGIVTSLIEKKFNSGRVLMTTSATHAIEMASIIVNLKPGDEVIMPSFTFPSTANAVLMRGAKIVFAEINENTLNIDLADVERKITCNTKAVIPVHYGGISCEMDVLMNIAKKNKLYVIEDAAHSFNARYKEKYLGTWGHFGCFSFHGTKNYTCGEGGALLINTYDDSMIEKGEIIRQKGTNRNKFIRGEIDKYSWVDIGSSYTPSDMLMAFLFSQLTEMDKIKSKRKVIHDYYSYNLMKFVNDGMIKISYIPEGCESNYHLFYLLFSDEKKRDKVISELKNRGITATTHFEPLHSSMMGQYLGYNKWELPVTEKVSRCLLRLPMYTEMTHEEMEYVIKNLLEILG